MSLRQSLQKLLAQSNLYDKRKFAQRLSNSDLFEEQIIVAEKV